MCEGLGKKIVENFWELKLIRYPQDIFNLDYNKISELGVRASCQLLT